MGVLLKKAGLGVLATLVLLADSMPVCAETSFYEPLYQMPEEGPEDYMILEEVIGDYEVREGDCLWNIAEQYLGSGERYPELMEMNPDVITDPDLLYPHTYLQLKRNVYVRKEMQAEETRMGPCRFDVLPGYMEGSMRAGDIYSRFAFTRKDSAHILCRLREKEQATVNILSNWEKCQNIIEKYAEKYYKDQVSDLTFQRYQSERGDEIYLFSYVFMVSGEAYGIRGSFPVYVSHGICHTEHIQAEFVGFHTEEGMEDVVRYLAAGFEELPASESGTDSVKDYDTAIKTYNSWDITGVCNSFGWLKEYFDGIYSQATHEEEPGIRSARDRIINYRWY